MFPQQLPDFFYRRDDTNSSEFGHGHPPEIHSEAESRLLRGRRQ